MKYQSPYIQIKLDNHSLPHVKKAWHSTLYVKVYKLFNTGSFTSKSQNIPHPWPAAFSVACRGYLRQVCKIIQHTFGNDSGWAWNVTGDMTNDAFENQHDSNFNVMSNVAEWIILAISLIFSTHFHVTDILQNYNTIILGFHHIIIFQISKHRSCTFITVVSLIRWGHWPRVVITCHYTEIHCCSGKWSGYAASIWRQSNIQNIGIQMNSVLWEWYGHRLFD